MQKYFVKSIFSTHLWIMIMLNSLIVFLLDYRIWATPKPNPFHATMIIFPKSIGRVHRLFLSLLPGFVINKISCIHSWNVTIAVPSGCNWKSSHVGDQLMQQSLSLRLHAMSSLKTASKRSAWTSAGNASSRWTGKTRIPAPIFRAHRKKVKNDVHFTWRRTQPLHILFTGDEATS